MDDLIEQFNGHFEGNAKIVKTDNNEIEIEIGTQVMTIELPRITGWKSRPTNEEPPPAGEC